MKKTILLLSVGFLFGYFVSDVLGSQFIKPVKAEVAGMNSYDLMYDYDFQYAVKDIVEDDCEVEIDGRINCR